MNNKALFAVSSLAILMVVANLFLEVSRAANPFPNGQMRLQGVISGPQETNNKLATSGSNSATNEIGYNRDIRPILTANCFACHGPDSAAREADLRLDLEEEAIARGAWVPGDWEASEGITRINEQDETLLMPPPESHKSLTDSEKALLENWVQQGAKYEPHWSFIAPQAPPIPEVKQQDWVRNPIDAFVLSRLEDAGLTPAPEADRYTLARRAALDLTGLPPSPEMVAEFIADKEEGAYERYLDRLLESKRWGEHRARYWLDVARYADTHGIHFDNFREMWTYRQWVIEAFNRNLPFDQFTIENIAGDLLPNADLDQKIASGFNRCNITTNEGGIIDEEYLVLYTRDRTETVSHVWLGLTTNCAVCHDHKFDPISQREFYELSAFFNNTTQGARDGNIKDSPPTVTVPRREDRVRWQELVELIPLQEMAVQKYANQANPAFEKWLSSINPTPLEESVTGENLVLDIPFRKDDDSTSEALLLGSEIPLSLQKSTRWLEHPFLDQAIELNGLATQFDSFPAQNGTDPYSFSAWLRPSNKNITGAIVAQMDESQAYRGFDFWLQNRQVGTHLISSWPDKGLKVVSKERLAPNRWTHVAVTYDGSEKASGVTIYFDGVKQTVVVEKDSLSGPTQTKVPLKIGQRHLESPVSQVGLAQFKLFNRVVSAEEAASLALIPIAGKLATSRDAERPSTLHLSDSQLQALEKRAFAWWLTFESATYIELQAVLASLRAEQNQIRSRSSVAHVMNERDSEPSAFILNRGEYDQRLDQVSAKTPAILPDFSEELPRNRLGLANWLLQDDHPLTSRVTVNRFWQEVFGTGIVKSAGDFGITGDLPSHPLLLDWLAVHFRESDWDVKAFYKLLLSSATYRQSAVTTPGKLELDFANRLLSRGPRFRMDAEMVRDYALESAGLLQTQIGGPSVKPYQPPGVWEAVAMMESNTRNYQQDSGDALYRRSMYTFWKRSAPPASMETFNAPSREFCTVQRERTNTPLQALTTLNDIQFVEAARVLAERTFMKFKDDSAGACRHLFQQIVCRPPTEQELELLNQLFQDYVATYAQDLEAANALVTTGEYPNANDLSPTDVAAYTMVANAILNLDEVLNK